MGLEPIRAFAHYPLKVARLPFRHNRMCNCWCSGTELNRRHGDFQSPALPTELPEQNMATPIGFEPTIFAVTGRHVKPLHHGAVSYLSEPLAFRQKVFYHVPLVLASLFFIFFIICSFPFQNPVRPSYQAKKIPCPDRGKGLVFHIILHNRSFAFPE